MGWFKKAIRPAGNIVPKKKPAREGGIGLGIEVLLVLLAVFGIFFFAGINIMVFILFIFCGVYLKFFRRRRFSVTKTYIPLTLLLILYIPVVQKVIAHGLSPYYIPIGAASMLIILTYADFELMFVFTMLLSIVVSDMLGQDFFYFLIMFTSSLLGGIFAYNIRLRKDLFRTGLTISASMLILLVLHISTSSGTWAKGNFIAAAVNGIICFAVVLITLPLFEFLFSRISNISLIEWGDSQQPLLKRLIMEAPGTYHHSLVVGNLAEAAAEAIGVNSLLARIGAYYHDVGKIPRAEYFVENQLKGENHHEKLSPTMSKLILMNHVKEGVELAKKYKLPRQIIDFIEQHHGTSLAYYFYQKAIDEKRSDVSEDDFRYPGPKPQTKEIAIVLLADSVEAAARTIQDPDIDKITFLIKKIIDTKVVDGQLDECDLTFRDLDVITKRFATVLSSMHHQRVGYPQKDAKAKDEKKNNNHSQSGKDKTQDNIQG